MEREAPQRLEGATCYRQSARATLRQDVAATCSSFAPCGASGLRLLEKVLGRTVDLVLADAMKPRLRSVILGEAVP